MAITFNAASSGSGNSGSATFLVPGGTAAQDVLIASFSVNTSGSGATVTAPGGWNLILRADTNYLLLSYYRVATSTEPTTYTWSIPNSQWAGGIADYQGVDTSTIFSGTPQMVQSSGGSTSVVGPSMTTVDANALVIASFGIFSSHGAVGVTPPAGYTERWDQNYSGSNSHIGELSDIIQTSAGATGAPSATTSNTAGVYSAHTLALKPSGVVSGALSMDVGVIPVL